MNENVNVKVTFWNTKLFKNQDGEEIPFGTELKW